MSRSLELSLISEQHQKELEFEMLEDATLDELTQEILSMFANENTHTLEYRRSPDKLPIPTNFIIKEISNSFGHPEKLTLYVTVKEKLKNGKDVGQSSDLKGEATTNNQKPKTEACCTIY